MVKIITSIGAGDELFQFYENSWKDEPENGLNRIKISYPIATSEERWKEITMSGEWFLVGYHYCPLKIFSISNNYKL